jgi:hypothetical protein
MLRFFSADSGAVEPLPRPPIDGQVPAILETATFAVG